MIKQFLVASLSALVFINAAHAFEMKGSVPAKIRVANANSKSMSAASSQKTVYLMKVKMTEKEKRAFFNAASQNIKSDKLSNDKLPSKADVGMNNVPVLDQGRHGACVTFAITGALDALIGQGDYISQLCNLELGTAIAAESYVPSGWNGSFGPIVLNQIESYGIVSKQDQITVGCAGKKEYPVNDENNEGSPMSLSDFHAISENINDVMFWEPLLDVYTRIFNDFDHEYHPEKTLHQVKKTLADNKPKFRESRLTLAVLLPENGCPVGACGKYHVDSDTWVNTESMKLSLLNMILGGHEMIITAYDDDAIALDNEGGVHKGLLTLRNSWGAEAGDKGNYYMSYDFFVKYVLEVNRIQFIQEESDEG